MKTPSLLPVPIALLLGASSATGQCPPQNAGQIDLHSYSASAVYFGRSVDLSSTLLAVGAPGYDKLTAGLAYVFEEDAGGWGAVGQLTPSTGEPDDAFGRSISIEGKTVLVGAPLHGNDEGRAYIFEEINGNWIETTILNPPEFHEEFGFDVLLAGTYAFIGAPKTEQVFVYEKLAGAWSVKTILTPPGNADDFGTSLALSSGRLLVGAPEGESVFVYELQAGQWLWTSTIAQPLLPANDFGTAVALDGDTAFVGAPEWNLEVGRVHQYEFDGTSWNEVAILLPDLLGPAQFGSALALEGNRLLIGAPAEEDLAGATYVFGPVAGQWLKDSKILPQLGTTDYNFGTALGIDPLTNTYFVNVGLEEVVIFGSANGYAGSVYIWSDNGCAGLSASPASISLAAGGVQTLSVSPGPNAAGLLYFVLGTASGSAPGILLDGVALPLNLDGYTTVSLLAPNVAPFGSTLGVLDAAGAATATFSLPAGFSPSLAGLQLDHAALVLDPQLGQIITATNAVSLSLLP